MKQSGLLVYWERKYYPQPDKCFGDINKLSRNHRISLNNLSGAFMVLLIGYRLATFVLIMEKIVYYHKKNAIASKTGYKITKKVMRNKHGTGRPAHVIQSPKRNIRSAPF